MGASWGIVAACKAATSRNPGTLIDSVIGYGVFVVSFRTPATPALMPSLNMRSSILFLLFDYLCTSRHILQISVAFVAICTSAFCFMKWRAASTYLWKLYGWFTAIICTACVCTFFKVASLITATYSISTIPAFRASATNLNSTLPAQMYSDLTQHQHWFAAFSFSCAFEFTFMSLAELLVLHRFLDLAFNGLSASAESNAISRRCQACASLAVCFSILDIMASCASMYYRLQTSVDSPGWYLSNRRADYATAAQMLSEVCALSVKAALFLFISRLDLQRISKIELMTANHLLPVRLKRA
jgi:hypothetical protein